MKDWRGKGDARRVPPQNYHVTLKFLGNVDEAAVPQLLAQVAALEGGEVTVPVVSIGGFPGPGRARLVAAELEPHPLLTAWHGRLAAELGAEERDFRPHVTVARLSRPRAFAPVAPIPALELSLAAPRLYRSDQMPGGVRYRPLAAS